MSENLDLVRSICAAWQRGDYSSVEWAHPQIEWVMGDGPNPSELTGAGSVAGEFGDFLSMWEGGFYIEAEDYRELDDSRVLAFTRFSGRGKSSGVEIAHLRAEGAHVFQLDGGKVTRLVAYWDRDRALADLGLASEGEAP
jgi:ketosteroid isomerase-like protein